MGIREVEMKELWSQNIRCIMDVNLQIIMNYDRISVAESLNVSATIHIQLHVCGPNL